MGTSDLNRGLLGHVFNGFENSIQKPELTSLIAKFRQPHIESECVTLEGPLLDNEGLNALLPARGARA